MKNRDILSAIALCGCVALVACNKSEEGGVVPSDSNMVRFGSVQSRAAAVESFAAGDQIFIAAVADPKSVATVGESNLYTVTSTNEIESEDPLYWTDDKLSFYAVNQDLAQSTGDESQLSYDLATAEDELLWVPLFDRARSDNEATPIAVKFQRCLSEMVVEVAFTGVYQAVNPDLELYIKANTALNFDPWASEFAAVALSGKPASDDYAASWSKCVANSSTEYSLLTLPQTIDAASEIMLVVKDSEGDAVKNITATAKDIILESGCRTTIKITINKSANEASVEVAGVSVEEFEAADMSEEDQLIIPNHKE